MNNSIYKCFATCVINKYVKENPIILPQQITNPSMTMHKWALLASHSIKQLYFWELKLQHLNPFLKSLFYLSLIPIHGSQEL